MWWSWSLDVEAFADVVGFQLWDQPSTGDRPGESPFGCEFTFSERNSLINTALREGFGIHVSQPVATSREALKAKQFKTGFLYPGPRRGEGLLEYLSKTQIPWGAWVA